MLFGVRRVNLAPGPVRPVPARPAGLIGPFPIQAFW